jgi:hypothetical protein
VQLGQGLGIVKRKGPETASTLSMLKTAFDEPLSNGLPAARCRLFAHALCRKHPDTDHGHGHVIFDLTFSRAFGRLV